MSALPPKADICSAVADVRYGPKADICSAKPHVRFSPKADIICGRALSASRQQVQETLTVFPAGYRRQTSSRSEVGYRQARSFHSPTKTLLSVLACAGMAPALHTVSNLN